MVATGDLLRVLNSPPGELELATGKSFHGRAHGAVSNRVWSFLLLDPLQGSQVAVLKETGIQAA